MLTVISQSPSLVDAFIAGYREHTRLEPEELDRLDQALVAHGLILNAWGIACRGAMPSTVLKALSGDRHDAKVVVEHTRQAFRRRSLSPTRGTDEQ